MGSGWRWKARGEGSATGSSTKRPTRWARRLREEGIKPQELVILCVDRSLELIIGILGILKAGAAYLPCEPDNPLERFDYILQESEARIILTQRPQKPRFSRSGVQLLCLDDPDLYRAETSNLDIPIDPSSLAYVIYTSGSTGKPKGVMIEHRNVTDLFFGTKDNFHFNERDIWTLFHSYAFDFSVWEIFGALFYGGKLIIVPYWQSRSAEDYYQLVHREKVTILNQTPSAFKQFSAVDCREKRDLSLRLIIFGGEALHPEILLPWIQRHGDHAPQLINMYGITETTVHVTHCRINSKGR